MITDCIILAGGLGTRLRSVVNDVPKVMAPVNGLPFLHYLITSLGEQNIYNVVFASGYKHEVIEEWLSGKFQKFNFTFSVEEEPLGTGGAIHKAMQCVSASDILVLNGDSYFELNYQQLFKFHRAHQADATIALKPMNDFDRYGCVEVDPTGKISAFLEKEFRKEGFINAGVYLLNRERFLSFSFPDKFSMEKDYLEKLFEHTPMYGFVSDGYFIDIGIPQDFARAQTDFINKTR